MNDNNSHWYLCVVELSKECIYILDSLPSTTGQEIRTKDVITVVLFLSLSTQERFCYLILLIFVLKNCIEFQLYDR